HPDQRPRRGSLWLHLGVQPDQQRHDRPQHGQRRRQGAGRAVQLRASEQRLVLPAREVPHGSEPHRLQLVLHEQPRLQDRLGQRGPVTASAARGPRHAAAPWLAAVVVIAALGGARLAREAAEAEAPQVLSDEPYAPAPDTAPLVTLGYRELAADLLFLPLKGYFRGSAGTADGGAALGGAIPAPR